MAKAFTAFRVAPELLDAMREIKTTDGVPMSVQVDFALRAWLQARGVRLQTEPKRRTAGNVSRSRGDDRGAALR